MARKGQKGKAQWGSKFVKPKVDRRALTGKAAACRVCNDNPRPGPDGPGCACIVQCGHTLCTGSQDTGYRQQVRPVGLRRPPSKLAAPKYDGPRGGVGDAGSAGGAP
jgi:hypothetical protein